MCLFFKHGLGNRLLRPFPPITLAAQHLAVFNDCPTAVAPRCDVVAFHLLDFKMLAAERTHAVLLFVNCQFDVVGEGSQTQVVLVACQHKRADTLFVLHFAVDDKPADFSIKLGLVQDLFVEAVEDRARHYIRLSGSGG